MKTFTDLRDARAALGESGGVLLEIGHTPTLYQLVIDLREAYELRSDYRGHELKPL